MSGSCRICLTKTANVLPLQSPLNEDLANEVQFTTLEILEIVMSQKLLVHEQLPAAICAECKNILKMTYDLRILFQNSQITLMEKLKDILPTSCMKNMEQKAPVELIFSGHKFDLKDVLIVEDKNSDNKHDFKGFLNNLGSTVSAVFVRKTKHKNGVNVNRQQQMKAKIDDSFKISEKVAKNELLDIQKTDSNLNNINPDFIHLCRTCGSQSIKKSKGTKCRECRRQSSIQKKLYLCDICGHSVTTATKLKYHRETHSGKNHDCEICHKQFSHRTSLNLHRKSHTNSRENLCTVCGKTFFYSNALVYHMRIHRNERNFVCEVCDKRFYMPCALKRHMRIHTDDRPYVCAFCSKGFRSNGEKRKHERIHTGERPYKCHFCEKAFVTKFNRSIHHMAHPGPHACDHCQRSFAEVEFLRKHVKSKHGDVEDEDDDKI